jgi:carbonic anhydrase
MKTKVQISVSPQIAALVFLLSGLSNSFATGAPTVSPGEALKRLMRGNDPVENAVRAQALDVAAQLQTAEPILAERVQSGKLKIVAARYDLDTGKVELLSPYPVILR